jgi:DNA-binding GntR family transcriptional regulator
LLYEDNPLEFIYGKIYNFYMRKNQNTNSNHQPISKTQQAYEFLKNNILEGSYGPGQRIVIDQVAKELGLSTIPIREAIRQLESDGLIQYKPYSGAIVSGINETEYIEVLTVLSVLEGYATALSSRNFTSGHIEQLSQINKQMEEALQDFDFERFGQLNRQFHAVIYEECGNTFLLEEIRQSQQRLDRVRRSIFTLLPQRTKQSIEEHAAIIKLFEQGTSFKEIEETVRNHRINTINAFKNKMDSNKKK